MGKKKYYPNNWEEYANLDDDNFIPHTFEEIMEWKVGGWELPSSVCCIIRVTDPDTRKVSEFVYQKHRSAEDKVQSLIRSNCEFTVCDHAAIHHIYPETVND